MVTNNFRELRLTALSKGLPAITSALGSAIAKAGAVCFADREHTNGAEFYVHGDFAETFKIFWLEVTDQMSRCWHDLDNATEYAAYSIAFLLVLNLTDYTVIRRSRKGTGFDYWLGYAKNEDVLLFQNKARLEVSGIRSGSNSQINLRVKKKSEQINASDNLGLPGYIVVVEFSTPQSQMVQK